MVWDSIPEICPCVYTPEEFLFSANSETALGNVIWDSTHNNESGVPTGVYHIVVSFGHDVIDGGKIIMIFNSTFRDHWNETFSDNYNYVDNDNTDAAQYKIYLRGSRRSRTFIPRQGISNDTWNNIINSPFERLHVLMQLYQSPTQADRATLNEAGIILGGYFHNYSYLASVPTSIEALNNVTDMSLVRWIGDIFPADKVSPDLLNKACWELDPDRVLNLNVIFYEDVSVNASKEILSDFNITTGGYSSIMNSWGVTTSCETFIELTRADIVSWISEISPVPTEDVDASNEYVE